MNVLVVVNDQPYGLGDQLLIEGVRRSTMDDLADWVLWAEKTLTF
jgi:sulfur relay (sulfurtransferase) complex TusBCD TusD component (DsrE family)